jgi:NADPH-dependent ferric siderophore reductase
MTEQHVTTRVRHDVRYRLLTVTRTERLTPAMVRITLAGPDLEGFASAGYDDHVKLVFPQPGQSAPPPASTKDGKLDFGDGVARPPLRDFTPRRFDTDELVIDFAIHETGPASDWAAQAKVGNQLGVGGPRGSFVVSDDFDWYLLVGDETALPAIGRRLEELRAGAKAIVVAAVAGPEEEQTFVSHAQMDIHWVRRPLSQASDGADLLQAVEGLTLPDGDGYAWVAGESLTAKAIREHLVSERGLNKAWVKAAGYWRAQASAIHDHYDD